MGRHHVIVAEKILRAWGFMGTARCDQDTDEH